MRKIGIRLILGHLSLSFTPITPVLAGILRCNGGLALETPPIWRRGSRKAGLWRGHPAALPASWAGGRRQGRSQRRPDGRFCRVRRGGGRIGGESRAKLRDFWPLWQPRPAEFRRGWQTRRGRLRLRVKFLWSACEKRPIGYRIEPAGLPAQPCCRGVSEAGQVARSGRSHGRCDVLPFPVILVFRFTVLYSSSPKHPNEGDRQLWLVT